MGYLKIPNLERNQAILEHKECYALEKVHGTSAHIKFNLEQEAIHYHHGGVNKGESFRALFDHEELLRRFLMVASELKAGDNITLYGEAYGGKLQGMSEVYGPNLAFIGFDVKVDNDYWLDVPNAFQVCTTLGQRFVPFTQTTTDLDKLEALRDAPSKIWAGKKDPNHKGEGIVLRPITECYDYRGNRIIAKFKTIEHKERRSPKPVNPGQKALQLKAKAFAKEFVVRERLLHVLDNMRLHPKFNTLSMDMLGDVIQEMVRDVIIEEGDDLIESERRYVSRYIGGETAKLFREEMLLQLREGK